MLDDCRHSLKALPDAVLGLAPHSLRAVTPQQLAALVPLTDGPIHIHIAEQQREVDACLAWSKQRPVQWLLANAPVDARWCLVHATHVDAHELQAIVASGAVVGLCPITEANLGDGVFPMQAFAAAGGRFGVGSDSNVLIDAAEELRLLEYGQRLTLQARNVVAQGPVSSGRWLYDQAGMGAAQALGLAQTGIRAGAAADLIELDTAHPALLARSDDALLDSWLFAARGTAVRNVWRGGRWVVREGSMSTAPVSPHGLPRCCAACWASDIAHRTVASGQVAAQRRAGVVVYALHLPMTGPGRNRQWLRLNRSSGCARSAAPGATADAAATPEQVHAVRSSMQRAWCMPQPAAGARCRPCGMPIE